MTLEDDVESYSESERLGERAADMPRSEEIALTEIFDDEFVGTNTAFETLDALVAASPADADTAAELSHVPDGAWDEFVAEHTDFEDEAAFTTAARDHWVAIQLGLDEDYAE